MAAAAAQQMPSKQPVLTAVETSKPVSEAPKTPQAKALVVAADDQQRTMEPYSQLLARIVYAHRSIRSGMQMKSKL